MATAPLIRSSCDRFYGNHLTAALRRTGADCFTPARG